MPDYYGILIGSSRFDGSALQNLRCPENDVDRLTEVFTSPEHGLFTKVFPLKNVSSQNARERIEETLRGAASDELVVIYYSGHGKLDHQGHLCLATPDTEVDRRLMASSIPLDFVASVIDDCGRRNVVLLLDCCFGGAAGESFFSRGELDGQLASLAGGGQLQGSGRGICLLTASTAIQTAHEKESDTYGRFTKHLIEGIESGKADRDADGFVTVDELYHYVYHQMQTEGAQTPQKWTLGALGELNIARAVRTCTEDWCRRVSQKLRELESQSVVPEHVLRQAKERARMARGQPLSQGRPETLLDELLEDRISVGEFVGRSYDMESEKTIQGVKAVVFTHLGSLRYVSPREFHHMKGQYLSQYTQMIESYLQCARTGAPLSLVYAYVDVALRALITVLGDSEDLHIGGEVLAREQAFKGLLMGAEKRARRELGLTHSAPPKFHFVGITDFVDLVVSLRKVDCKDPKVLMWSEPAVHLRFTKVHRSSDSHRTCADFPSRKRSGHSDR